MKRKALIAGSFFCTLLFVSQAVSGCECQVGRTTDESDVQHDETPATPQGQNHAPSERGGQKAKSAHLPRAFGPPAIECRVEVEKGADVYPGTATFYLVNRSATVLVFLFQESLLDGLSLSYYDDAGKRVAHVLAYGILFAGRVGEPKQKLLLRPGETWSHGLNLRTGSAQDLVGTFSVKAKFGYEDLSAEAAPVKITVPQP